MRKSLGAVAAGLALAAALLTLSRAAVAAESFTLFETGQVRPLAQSPDGARLFAINTPDGRLEIFDVGVGTLTKVASVPVGVEPIAVVARTNTEVWVVNHLSDSVSIVDVTTPASARVVRTLLVGDEPRDLVFAGPGGNRAFITTAHRGQNTALHPTIETVLETEGIGRADVWVFDATNLGAALGGTPETIVTVFGDTPRALAVSPDGSTVYAAVFHSGNRTTVLSEGAVPNGGEGAGGLPEPNDDVHGDVGPETGLIVKFDGTNWLDELGRIWDAQIRFSIPDHDVFVIDANANPPVQLAGPAGFYAGVGTVLFNMVAHPTNGKVYVANLESLNEVRFEGPGTYASLFKPPGEPATVRGHLAESRITVLDGGSVLPRHLNKHIDYDTCCAPLPNAENDDSLGFPLGMAISSDGSTLYVAGFGSSEVGVYDTAALDLDTFTPDAADQIAVSGGGPTGVVLDETRSQLYVLTRFDNAVSVVSTGTGQEVRHVRLHNPEPPSVVAGRPFLYDTSFTSSHGDSACASCHIFGDLDSLAWDLGNPDDETLFNFGPFTVGGVNFSDPIFPGVFKNFHPMKGPMTTQSLRGMANHGPMHWRGDRNGFGQESTVQPDGGVFDEDLAFKQFNGAFEGLIGRSVRLTEDEMQRFTDFVLQVTYPPNPIRNLDNSLTPSQQNGRNFYFGAVSDTFQNCNGCHVLDPNANPGDPKPGFFGGDGRSSFENETQHLKIPHLRNMYQKVGMFGMAPVPFFNPGNNGFLGDQIRGFGFLHDGSVDTLFRFHNAAVFNQSGINTTGIPAGVPGDGLRRDMDHFMMAFDTNLAPIVGQQITRTDTNGAAVDPRISLLIARANAGECDLVVKGHFGGEDQGFLYTGGGAFATDRALEAPTSDLTLRALADTPGQELTYTCVPPGNGLRVGIDQDGDGVLDGDERDAGSDPRNAADPNPCAGDPACQKCQRAVAKEGSKYVQARSKALVGCELAKVKGSLPFATDCVTEPKAAGKISKAAAKLASAIDKACGGADRVCGGDQTGELSSPAVGFVTFCPNLENGACGDVIVDCGGIAACLACIDGAATDQANGLSFGALVDTDPSTQADLNKCQQAIGKEAQKLLAAESKALLKCWDAKIKGKHTGTCPDAGAAVGTPSRKAADVIAKARTKASASICKACGGADGLCDGTGDFTPAAIGFATSCDAVTPPGGSSCAATITTAADIASCVTCVADFKAACMDRAAVPGLGTYPSECN